MTLMALLQKIGFTRQDELFLLGDYIDRGPDSAGVLDSIFMLLDSGYRVHCLLGNHEQALLNAIEDKYWFRSWVEWGGRQTLESFQVSHPSDIPAYYLEFLQSLPYVLEVDEYILVHAGLNFFNGDPLAPCAEMLTLRNWYHTLDYEWLGDRFVLHGHTQTDFKVILDQLKHLERNCFLNLDNGCYNVGFPDRGRLLAFELGTRTLSFQTNIDNMHDWQVRAPQPLMRTGS
ncbi:MAG: serine/threonine protein phosphatase [Bacteroidetes bacterium]|nr:MAG: serine/threonine protein phosphatase [Bacteroidota bacterium]